MDKRPRVNVSFACTRFPYKGFEDNKPKPKPDTATLLLLACIELGAVGGKKWTLDAFEYRTTVSVNNSITTIAPILAFLVNAQEWMTDQAYLTWQKTLNFFQKKWLFPMVVTEGLLPKIQREAVDKLSGELNIDNESASFYFRLYFLIKQYPWDGENVRAFQDFKNIHRLLYLLLTKSIILPTSDEAIAKKGGAVILTKMLYFDTPNYSDFAQMTGEYQNEKKFLESWVNQRISEINSPVKYCIQDGFLIRKPLLSDFAIEFVDGLVINLLKIVLESFTTDSEYLSMGQLYLGVCPYCGSIFSRDYRKLKYCPDVNLNCRQNYEAAERSKTSRVAKKSQKSF